MGNDVVDPGQDPDLEVKKGKNSHLKEVDLDVTNGFNEDPTYSIKKCFIRRQNIANKIRRSSPKTRNLGKLRS